MNPRRPPKGIVSGWTRIRRAIWFWVPWVAGTMALLFSSAWWLAPLTAFVALFVFLASPTEAPPQYGLDHTFSIESDTFLDTVSGLTGATVVPGNSLSLMINGDAFYPVMLDAIKHARRSITIEAYIYWDGDVGDRFAEALAERARAGVPVRVLLDAIGSSSLSKSTLRQLEESGCKVAWYNPIRWSFLWRANHRTHRKSLIIDGRIGFTGGAGFADVWSGNAEGPGHWRDTQIRLDGPAVVPLQTGFAQNWVQATAELVTGTAYFPTIPPSGSLSVMTIMSSPEAGASPARLMYYLSIGAARHSIDIANPYFVPDAVAIDMLIDAKKRGVRVRIMISGIHNDNLSARRNSVRLCGQLLEAGIEVWAYNRTMLHQKTMVADRAWSTVGTANFDSRSFAHNEESNVCLLDAGVAGEMTAAFERDLSSCDPLDLRAWRHRSLRIRVQEFFAWFLEDQV